MRLTYNLQNKPKLGLKSNNFPKGSCSKGFSTTYILLNVSLGMARMAILTMVMVWELDTKDFSLSYSKKCSGTLTPSKLMVCGPSTDPPLFNTSKMP